MSQPPKPGPRPGSRPPSRGRVLPPRHEAAPKPGPAVQLADFATAFDPATIWHAARVRGSFVKFCLKKKHIRDPELTEAIRAATADLAHGYIQRRDTGVFEVTHNGWRWLITPDCRVLIAVNRAKEPRCA